MAAAQAPPPHTHTRKNSTHTPQVDFLRYTGAALKAGSPTAAALLGTSSMLMSTYATSLELTQPLLGAAASVDTIAAAAVRAAYTAATSAYVAGGDGAASLTSAADLTKVYLRSYEIAAPTARRRSLLVALRTAAELEPLFASVAKVRRAPGRIWACLHGACSRLRPPPALRETRGLNICHFNNTTPKLPGRRRHQPEGAGSGHRGARLGGNRHPLRRDGRDGAGRRDQRRGAAGPGGGHL